MPALPFLQRPESVASEKRTYRLSLNDYQSNHRRCKTFPGNEKDGAKLIDNEVNNEALIREQGESFLEQWFLANKDFKHDYDVPAKYNQVPSPTPTFQRTKKIKSHNRRGLPRWVSKLGLWLPPQQKLLLYETFAKHVELLDRSKAQMLDPFPHLGRCGHARTLSALERQQLRLQMEEHCREAERFERLLDRFNKITETWASLQNLADTRNTEHNARLQAFNRRKDQYVDPLGGIRQKRMEREKLEREKQRLQDEARERARAKRRRKIPKIIITDHDEEMRQLQQSSLSSIQTEESGNPSEAMKIKLDVPVCESENDYPASLLSDNQDLESEVMVEETPELLKESSPVPCPVEESPKTNDAEISPVEDIPDIDNGGEDQVDSDISMSLLAPPSMTSLAHDGMLLGDGSVSADDTAGLMTGITPIPLGLSNGLIPDTAIRSSSSIDRYHSGAQARLNNTKKMKKGGAWCPKISSDKEYLEVDLGSVATVMQVATQGYPGDKNIAKKDLRWVTTYTLSFSNDGKKWEKYEHGGTEKVFQGNVDNNTVVLHSLPSPVESRYVRFYPKTWRNGIAMRTEVFGAFPDDALEPFEPSISPDLTMSEPPEDLPPAPEPSPDIKPPTPVTRPLTPPIEVEEESEGLERFKCSPDQMASLEGWEEETIKSIADPLSEEEIEEREVRLNSACLSIQGSKQTPKVRRKNKKPKPVKKEKKKKPAKKKHVKLPAIESAMNDLPEEENDEEEPEVEDEPEEDFFRMPTPPLPEIPKAPVDVRIPVKKERVSMFPTKPSLKKKDTRLSRARADNSIRDELLRQQLAEERRKKLLQLDKKKTSQIRRSPSIDSRFSYDDDDSFIFKYCIMNEGQLGYYRRIFESIDEDKDGFLFPEEILEALECVNKNLLNDSHLKYILRVLELCDCSVDSGADFKFFSVIAAFSQKVAALDDYAKILISKLDFRELDYKLQRARSLFKCYADEYTGKMSMEHLTLELTVGGLDSNTKNHVLRSLGPTTYLDFLDFLTYIPLFIHIHEHVLTNPLHDPRSYPNASLRKQTICK